MSPLAKVQVYPSGQRGRAQDPLHSASQVRILPPAPIRIIVEEHLEALQSHSSLLNQ